jgi:Tol biopolymer transport system component
VGAHTLISAGAAGAVLLLAGCGGSGEGRSPAAHDARIAFFRTGTGEAPRYSLATARPDGREVRVLTGDGRPGTIVPGLFARPAWSPDAREVAFAGMPRGDRSGQRTDIYVMNPGGGNQRRVTKLRDAFDPLWSPDGRRIIFTRRRLGLYGVNGPLWELTLHGGKVRQLTQRLKGRLDTPGTFSADGQTLLFTRTSCKPLRRGECLTTTGAIYAVRPNGSNPRKLIGNGSDPALSPNGTEIAFVSDRDRNGKLSYGDRDRLANELYLARPNGKNQRRLSHTRALNERGPSWRGSRIAYQRGDQINNAEGMSLFEVNSDGTCRHAILADPKLDIWYASPAWQPTKGRGAVGHLRC